MDFNEVVERSVRLREQYHNLERQFHQTEWTVEEDALAFLTDAGLVGRLTMSQQGRWPANKSNSELEHKLGECIWWLIVLAERMNIDTREALERFLLTTEKQLRNILISFHSLFSKTGKSPLDPLGLFCT
ncbi:MazG-like protein [Paenibacillus sp. OVF10]|nr:MazG-like protein [Paenibacillus sp. OVF10]